MGDEHGQGLLQFRDDWRGKSERHVPNLRVERGGDLLYVVLDFRHFLGLGDLHGARPVRAQLLRHVMVGGSAAGSVLMLWQEGRWIVQVPVVLVHALYLIAL